LKKPVAVEFCFRPDVHFAIESGNMRSILLFVLGICVYLQTVSGAFSAEIRLTNGDVIRGEPASYDDNGLVVRLDIGGFSPRINWTKISQESLMELMKNPQAAKFVEPFLDSPPEEQVKAKQKKEIKVQPVTSRLELPPQTSLSASLTTPIGLFILGILYLANLYAAFEIARFRNRPPSLVCGLSAILPIVGPLIFLSMPTRSELVEEAVAGGDADSEAAAAHAAQAKKTGPAPSSGLGLSNAQGDKKAAGQFDNTAYKRGETTFNRRFFETKFPGFFRVVPSEAEKDLVLVIRATKNEHVAKRISRISSSELHVQLLRGNTEVMVPFADIAEIQVKHKDTVK
jgi:hypothetical protein